MSTIFRRSLFWTALVLLSSFIAIFVTTNTADAATPVYRVINNQTIKFFYTQDVPNEQVPSTVRYFFAETPQNVGHKDGGPYVGITEADNNPTICKQWLSKTGGVYKMSLLGRTNGACHDESTQLQISTLQMINQERGEGTFFFQSDATTIKPAIHTASNSEFKKVTNTNGLGLQGDQAVYVQTQPSVSCPRLLVKYRDSSWGFIAPVQRDTYQSDEGSVYYLEILKKYGMDTSSMGNCHAGDSHDVRANNMEVLADVLGSDGSFWRVNKTDDDISFHKLNGNVLGINENKISPVGDATAAEIKLGVAPEGSVSSGEGGTSGGGATNDDTTSCAIEGVGWIICPVVTFLGTIADSAYGAIEKSLVQVDPEFVRTNGGTYAAWNIMRSFANAAFVIAFLIIIFAQLTGRGVANYGIKKMLPRLIVAAVLVNISWLICQLAVDLSNILGASLSDLFKGVAADIKAANPPPAGQADQSGLWGGLIPAIIIAGGVAWAAGLSVLLPLLLGALVAVCMTLIILSVRQVAIVLLIAVAPIAFVAYILPNTSQWFTKWRKMFVGLLMVYPLIGVLFGGSALASAIIQTSNQQIDNDIMEILGVAMLAIPLFLLPMLLKSSINALGSIGAKISNAGDKLSRGAQSKAGNSGIMKSLDRRKMMKRAQVGAGIYSGKNPVSRVRSRVNRGLNKSDVFNKLTGDYGTARGSAIDKLEDEEQKTAIAAIKLAERPRTLSNGTTQEGIPAEKQFDEAIKRGDVSKARAAQALLMNQGGAGVDSVRKTLQKNINSGAMDQRMTGALTADMTEKHASIASEKSPDLLSWAAAIKKDGVEGVPTVRGHGDGGRRTLSGIDSVAHQGSAWAGKSAKDLAKMTDESFTRAIQSGSLDPEMLATLNSAELKGSLTQKKAQALSRIGTPILGHIGDDTRTTAPSSSSPASPPPSTPPPSTPPPTPPTRPTP